MRSTRAPAGLPAPLGRLLGRPLQPLGHALLPRVVNRALARQIEDGLLDFLAARVLEIAVTDLGLAWRLTFDARTRRVRITRGAPDTAIRGDSAALLLLASQRTDPDTLFFRRRLAVEGDTELGLQAKNLLDTLEPEDLPLPIAHLLDRAGRLIERWS